MGRWKWRLGALVVLFTVAGAGQGRANFFSGNQLFAKCQVAEGSGQWSDCLGYVTAISDAMEHSVIDDFSACVPDGVSRVQLNAVVVRHMQKHPEWRHYSADSLVASALSEAFPCPKPKS